MLAWRIDASYVYPMLVKSEDSLRTYIAASFFVLCALMPLTARADDTASTTNATSSSATTTISIDLSASTASTSSPQASMATSSAAVATTTDATSTTPTLLVHTNVGIEDKVRAAFTDAPIMVIVAKCESRFRQYTDSGNVLYSGYNNGMVGIFQLYASIHQKAALAMGFDITSVDGNIGYAHHLYDSQGTDPWLDSFKCWNPGTAESVASTSVAVLASNTTASGVLTIDMSLGKIDPQVLSLQKMLNAMGYTVASNGPGSTGQETTKYGTATRNAVRSFQCAKNIACSGNEGTTGYGFVGARTRAALTLAYAGNQNQPKFAAATPVISPIPSVATSTAASDENAAVIASLRAQLAQLTNILAALIAQRAEAATQTAGVATAVMH